MIVVCEAAIAHADFGDDDWVTHSEAGQSFKANYSLIDGGGVITEAEFENYRVGQVSVERWTTMSIVRSNDDFVAIDADAEGRILVDEWCNAGENRFITLREGDQLVTVVTYGDSMGQSITASTR